jgi:hypothetical protein
MRGAAVVSDSVLCDAAYALKSVETECLHPLRVFCCPQACLN